MSPIFQTPFPYLLTLNSLCAWRISHVRSRSASDQFLQVFRVASPLNRDFGCSAFEFAQIFRRKLNGSGSDIFAQAMQLRGARNRNNPRLLGQQPREGDLGGGHFLLFRKSAEQINEGLIRFSILGAKTRDLVAEVGAVELRVLVDLSREEAFTQRTERNEIRSPILPTPATLPLQALSTIASIRFGAQSPAGRRARGEWFAPRLRTARNA